MLLGVGECSVTGGGVYVALLGVGVCSVTGGGVYEYV